MSAWLATETALRPRPRFGSVLPFARCSSRQTSMRRRGPRLPRPIRSAFWRNPSRRTAFWRRLLPGRRSDGQHLAYDVADHARHPRPELVEGRPRASRPWFDKCVDQRHSGRVYGDIVDTLRLAFGSLDQGGWMPFRGVSMREQREAFLAAAGVEGANVR